MKMSQLQAEVTEVEDPAPNFKTIEVYVCPRAECPDYYGAVNMPKLEEEFTGAKLEDQSAMRLAKGTGLRHNRAECPTCRARGVETQRVRVKVTAVVSAIIPPTPSLPPR